MTTKPSSIFSGAHTREIYAIDWFVNFETLAELMSLIPDGVKGLSLLINGLVVSVDNHIGPLSRCERFVTSDKRSRRER